MKNFVSALLATLSVASPDVAWESLGTFKMSKPAFPTVSTFQNSDPFLLCSSFKAMGSGHVWVVPNVSEAVKSGDVSGLTEVELKTPKFQWPNDVQVVPHDVFGFNAIVVPDGFLVPGHSDGGVYVIKMDDNDITQTVSTTKISPQKKGYFYHMGFWVDLNGDGRKDFLTARSNAQPGGGQLVWFEQPSAGLDGNEWAEHVITAGPDVGITLVDDIYPGEYVIFAAQFFDELLSLYRISKTDGSFIDSRVLDDKILSAYSVTYADINGDGIKDLMVNNHETSNKTNGIWAYTAPVDWMTEDWTKHTIATGFHNAFSITVPNMSPGFPYPFYPKESNEAKWNAPAHILVAGDGDHTAHIMTPTDPKNFKWELDTLKKMGGTVGALTWADLDQDGWNEVWVPNYDGNVMEVFKMMPLGQAEAFLQ